MDITIGVCVHNEEANIGKLLDALLAQELNQIRIKQIIAVSSGSTDSTDHIVAEYAKRSKRVVLLRELSRMGKVSAINLLLKTAQTKLIVLISGDVLPLKHTIERLCIPFKDQKLGISGCRPKPINNKTSWLGFAVHVVWGLHHKIAKQNPKYGECICFRKLFKRLPNSTVDEEEIASIILKQGYTGRYVPSAVVINKGPTTISDFIKQRRRIYAGHLVLRKKTGYAPPTMSNLKILLLILFAIDLKAPFKTGFAIGLEAISRLLGYWDFYTGRKHLIWEIADSTKELN